MRFLLRKMPFLPRMVLLFLVVATLPCRGNTVYLANGEWPPFQSSRLNHGGFVSHIVAEAFASQGVEVEFTYLPWKRGYQQARFGALDGTFIWGKTSQREESFYFSDAVVGLSTAVFFQSGKEVSWENIPELGQYRVGGVIGYDYGLSEWEQSGTINILRLEDLDVALKMLVKNRLDVVLADVEVGLYTLRKLGLENKVSISEQRFNTDKLFYLLISRQIEAGPELIKAFNKGLTELKQSGQLEALFRANRNGEYLKK